MMFQQLGTLDASRGLGFDFQHTHGRLELLVTPVPEDSMPSSGFCWHQAEYLDYG